VFLPPGTIKKCFQDIINIIFATIVQSADDLQIAETGQGQPAQELTAEQTALSGLDIGGSNPAGYCQVGLFGAENAKIGRCEYGCPDNAGTNIFLVQSL
jgi:hypothetical protein